MKNENTSVMGTIYATISDISSTLFIMLILGVFIGGLFAPMFYNVLATSTRNKMWISGTTVDELKALKLQLKLLKGILWIICILSWCFLIFVNL